MNVSRVNKQARSQDFSRVCVCVGGGGGGCVWALKMHSCRGGPGACFPGKNLEILDCHRLHFARFHCGEGEKENLEQLKEKVNRQRLII